MNLEEMLKVAERLDAMSYQKTMQEHADLHIAARVLRERAAAGESYDAWFNANIEEVGGAEFVTDMLERAYHAGYEAALAKKGDEVETTGAGLRTTNERVRLINGVYYKYNTILNRWFKRDEWEIVEPSGCLKQYRTAELDRMEQDAMMKSHEEERTNDETDDFTPADIAAARARCEAAKGIYVASKTKHAQTWKELRAGGVPIISTWIDEAGVGETDDFVDLWRRCISEATSADAVVLYREPGDVLKGAFVEVGAAIAARVPVHTVGCAEFSFVNHPLVTQHDSIEDAVDAACHARTDLPRALDALVEARRERDEAISALYKYGNHLLDCQYHDVYAEDDIQPCTCGLDALLAKRREKAHD